MVLYWNLLEFVLTTASDLAAPYIDPRPYKSAQARHIPANVKNKINRRKCLLKLDRLRNSNCNFLEIRMLSKDIRNFHYTFKKNKITNLALSKGKANNLWRAIKVAKNVNQDTIPSNMTLGGQSIEDNNRANAFAMFFKE